MTFLNSTTLQLSWVMERAEFAVAGPWAPWWGLWASLFVGWTFVASARCWPERAWQLPLAVCGMVLLVRALEFPISALGFGLALPWGGQILRRPFRPFFSWDLGLWMTTLVLVLPALVTAWLGRRGAAWPPLRFGVTAGLVWGGLLAAQFLMLRPILDLPRLDGSSQLMVAAVALVAGVLGGIVGAYQGTWLAHFRR